MRGLAVGLALAFGGGSASDACTVPGAGVDIYPTAAMLPSNLLRFYVYFPEPMGFGNILDHVALLDAEGRALEGVFLSNSHDLWSPDRRRLTLIFDPGRVKTGLAAHEELGRALEPGLSYTLLIWGEAMAQDGCPLGTAATHDFTAGPPDLQAPAPRDWVLNLPSEGGQAPLEVALGDAHDHLSLAYRLRILDADGDVVPGRIDLGPDEASWSFAPQQPWGSDSYQLVIDPRLEDLAGNRPGLLFDHPVDAPVEDWTSVREWQPVPGLSE